MSLLVRSMSSKIALSLFISLAISTSFLTGCRRNSIPSPEPVTGSIDQSSGTTTLPSNVQIGSTVTMKYTITTADGAIRKQQDNETIVIGQNTLNAYVESQLVSMQKNEEKKILVVPAKGFGTMYDFEKEERLPISVFTSANLAPQSGQRYDLG